MKHKLFALGAVLLLTAALVGCGDRRAHNDQPSAGYISMERAQETALNNAQVAAADADISSTTLVDVAGITCYKVAFTAGDYDYTCSVHAETGEIIEADYRVQGSAEVVDPAQSAATQAPSAATEQIDEVTAKEIALGHAGVSAADATFVKAVLDYENGWQVYDIEWYANGAKYDYEIAVANGAILSSGYEAAGIVDTTGLPPASADITLEQAKQTALDHAGVKAADATIYKAERDYDDGRLVYEIEFYAASGSGVTEYDYEIDANTGKVLSYDYDIENYAPAAGNTTAGNNTTVSADTAKQTALARVTGATAADIREWKLDYDDGRTEYEGKIIYDGMEYEFTIDAATGSVTEWEVERRGW